MALVKRQDDTLRNEFIKRIQTKVQSQKEAMKENIDKDFSPLMASIIKPLAGFAFDRYRNAERNKGEDGEVNVALTLRFGLSDEWVLMNDVIVEPEPDVFAQIDHVLIGPPGLFIIETKAWQGAFTGFYDKWKRREGNNWMPCDSPTKQNLRHVRLIRKWLDATGKIRIDLPPDQWVHAAVTFTNASWIKTDKCCMPIFDGALNLLGYLKKQRAKLLNQEQIDSIVTLLAVPIIAKTFINNEVKVTFSEEDFQKFKEEQAKEAPPVKTCIDESPVAPVDSTPLIEEGIGKNGKKYVRITGENQQAEGIRQKYIEEGKKVGNLNKDKFKKGIFYFYLED